MKLQIGGRGLRVRIDEAELASLRAGEALALAPRVGAHALVDLRVELGDAFAFDARDMALRLRLPRADVEAYAASLPRRDGLRFDLPGDGALRLDFEVDVRDSVATRGAVRRGH